jgi:hypothetical protein
MTSSRELKKVNPVSVRKVHAAVLALSLIAVISQGLAPLGAAAAAPSKAPGRAAAAEMASLQPGPVALVGRAPLVESVDLPASWDFDSIAMIDGRPTLLADAGYPAGRGPSRCMDVAVEVPSLRFKKVRRYSCNTDPTAQGLAYPVLTATKVFNAEVRIARTNPVTGRTVTGPVVMTFGQYSTSRLVYTSGYGSLWLYDVDTPRGAELLRVSSTSGKAEDRIFLPQRPVRPLLAAEQDGLWMGISPGGSMGGSKGSPFYFVRDGGKSATLAWRGGNNVLWAMSDAGHVWFDMLNVNGQSSNIVRFDGPGFRPALDVRVTGAAAGWLTQEAVLGSGAEGFWTMEWPPSTNEGASCGAATVLFINPVSGQVSEVARLPGSVVDEYDGCNGLDDNEGVIYNGRFLVLTGSLQSTEANGYTQLYAVSLPSS